MKKLALLSLLFACFFSVYSQNAETNSNQVKRYYYRDSIISMEKWYGNDSKLDSLKTYHIIGSINEAFYYKKGSLHGFGYNFDKAGKKITTWEFKKGRTIQRINHTLDIEYVDKEKVQNLFDELKELNDTLNYNSDNIKALTKRANLRLMLYNRTLALNDFLELENRVKYLKKSGRKINPKFLYSFYGSIGFLYSMFEDDDKILDYKYKCLSLKSKNRDIVNNMVANYNFGAYLYSMKAYRLSLHYLNIVLKKWKKHGFTNRTLANLYTDLGQYKIALSHAEIAFPKEDTIIKYSTRKPVKDLRTIRGWLYYKTGETNKGIIDLKEALEINKENAFAHRNLGVIYHDIGNYELACKHLQKAKDLYYEEIYDRYDLDSFLKSSCANKPVIKTKEVASIYKNLIEEPYISPNPIIDHCTVKNFPHDIYDYEIYDMSSKLITQNRTTKNTIDISSLPQGVYKLNIIKDSLVKTFLIIKE